MNAQELPPVVNYSPNDYDAGNQNWMVSKSSHNYLYFANNSGLLEFTGEKWNLYPVPNKTVVRSVLAFNKRIYTGAYMEFGYWTPDEFGMLTYHSLLPQFKDGLIDGEQFWNIEYLEDLIIFRSFESIYIYNPESNEIKALENTVGKPVSAIYKLNGEIYFQYVQEGLYKIENGKAVVVIPQDILEQDTAIITIFSDANNLGLITSEGSFLSWNGSVLTSLFENTQLNLSTGILSALQNQDNKFVLGTVGNGLVILSENGEILYEFNQKNNLINNTGLSVFEDESGNIWAGLDYGIAMLDLQSSFTSYQDNRGEIGAVYSALQIDDKLYLGTNQGLYLKSANSNNFDLVPGTNGQVWSIAFIDNYIFCAHNNGTFLIEDDKALKISNRLGTWLVKKYDENTYIQGHYNGISFLKNTGGAWTDGKMLSEFPYSSKFISVQNDKVWVGNEHKGVFSFEVSRDLENITNLKNYRVGKESGVHSSIFKFNDSIYYSSKEEIYQYQPQVDSFSATNSLNELLTEERISGRVVKLDDAEEIWAFGTESIFKISPATLDNHYEKEILYLDRKFRNIALGYENIIKINASEYILGISNGYLRFLDSNGQYFNTEISINKIQFSNIENEVENVNLEKEGDFAYTYNNAAFSYSAPVYSRYLESLYSYRLKGLSDTWSTWGQNSEIEFKNLDHGDYVFEVRSKIGETISESEAYKFEIQRPFYLGTVAIIFYGLCFALIVIGFNYIYRKRHRKRLLETERALKMRNLQAEQEIIKLKNEKLEQQMVNKNRELAASTMSLIKKNEFLTSIKADLKNAQDSSKVKSVINTIDKDINEKDNWEFFEKAFKNADKDFFKKIKDRYPDLTSSDLKLCAYLRLNLSSKEIAPLLNISTKSVEIKRYRLRKKMNLERNINLTEYILQL